MSIQFNHQTARLQLQGQPTQLLGASGKTMHLQEAIAIGPQGEPRRLLQQHPHLGLTSQRDCSNWKDQAGGNTGPKQENGSGTHTTPKRDPVWPACPGPARWQHDD